MSDPTLQNVDRELRALHLGFTLLFGELANSGAIPADRAAAIAGEIIAALPPLRRQEVREALTAIVPDLGSRI